MKNLPLIIIIILFISLFLVFINNQNTPDLSYTLSDIESLSPPQLKAFNNNNVGKTINVSGSAYQGAKILFYINDEYKYDSIVNANGDFNGEFNFTSGGEYSIKTKQTYKNITSDFSNELKVEADITPPNDDLEITTKIPEITKEKLLEISGKSSSANYVILNNNKIEIDDSGFFNIKHYLSEGFNSLTFQLEDNVGNNIDSKLTKSIKVDSTPPRISTSSYCATTFSREGNNLGSTEEFVCLSIGDWQGYLDSYNSVAIVGSVKGEVKNITVDGKNIKWDENNEIYQRISIYINGGLNKYKVIVKDYAGNSSSAYVETNAKRDDKDININLEEY